jgi:hypothetical protein
MPYALWGKSDPPSWGPLVEVFVMYAEWEYWRDVPLHTDATLQMLDGLWILFSDAAQQVFASFSKSGFSTVKWHLSTSAFANLAAVA